MLTFNGNLKVYVALQPCDMRKSFNGLSEIARNTIKVDPTSGAAFLFTNKRRNRFQALYYDRTGVCILKKRLEIGTFSWPDRSKPDQQKITLTPEALNLLFDGVDLRGGAMRPWYERD